MIESPFEALGQVLLDDFGVDIREIELPILEQRIQAYCQAHALPSLEACLRFIRGDAARLRELGDVVYSHTTRFNRSPEQFDLMVAVARQRQAATPLTVWSLGCSTGQEAYTIAIHLLEHVFSEAPGDAPFQVVGFDCSPAALRTAVRGCYSIADVLGWESLDYRKYFEVAEEEPGGYLRVAASVKRRVTFRHLNLVTSDFDGLGTADVVFLRNVLEFHTDEVVATIVTKVRAALADGGTLILGEKDATRLRGGQS